MVSVSDVVKEHWATYGRNIFLRYDYEANINTYDDWKLLKIVTGDFYIKVFPLHFFDDWYLVDNLCVQECESEGANKMIGYLRDLVSSSRGGDKYG